MKGVDTFTGYVDKDSAEVDGKSGWDLGRSG